MHRVCFLIITLWLLFFSCNLVYGASSNVKVTASIPTRQYTIFGFTCPNCQTTLDSPYIQTSTTSKPSGLFFFTRVELPVHSDICLYSVDSQNLQTVPVCIPLPQNSSNLGPVILSPTLALDSTNQTASGQSVPNTPVSVFIFQQALNAPLVKTAQAFSLPHLATKSNDSGFFSFSLPTVYATSYRLFAATRYQNNPSPKSLTLSYSLAQPQYYLYILIPLFLLTLILFFYLLYHSKKHYLPVPLALPQNCYHKS